MPNDTCGYRRSVPVVPAPTRSRPHERQRGYSINVQTTA